MTPDRDEHVRVSWYPEGYVVERFCLGLERCVTMTWMNVFLGSVNVECRFVSATHIPGFDPGTLISTGAIR